MSVLYSGMLKFNLLYIFSLIKFSNRKSTTMVIVNRIPNKPETHDEIEHNNNKKFTKESVKIFFPNINILRVGNVKIREIQNSHPIILLL